MILKREAFELHSYCKYYNTLYNLYHLNTYHIMLLLNLCGTHFYGEYLHITSCRLPVLFSSLALSNRGITLSFRVVKILKSEFYIKFQQKNTVAIYIYIYIYMYYVNA